MDRNIKKRAASRKIVKGLVVKINEIFDDENKRHEVERMMKTIEVKMAVIEKLNDSILDEIDENDLETDMEGATMFEM